jgi:hypothetical protein
MGPLIEINNYSSKLTILPSVAPIEYFKVTALTVSLINRTDPSPMVALTPPP